MLALLILTQFSRQLIQQKSNLMVLALLRYWKYIQKFLLPGVLQGSNEKQGSEQTHFLIECHGGQESSYDVLECLVLFLLKQPMVVA